MNVKVLGPGCMNCVRLANVTEEALRELGLAVPVEKVTSYEEILSYGIMRTPALVVNGEVKFAGHIPPKDKIVEVLSQALAAERGR